MDRDVLRLAGVVRESIVDGPGLRFTVFCQGCPHHCPGCHNEATHDFAGGTLVEITRIMDEINKNPLIDGVTFSGGEPFCQPVPFLNLAARIKEKGLHLAVFSGYTYEELQEMAADASDEGRAVSGLLQCADWLIDGRFELEKRDLTLAFRGSSNQRIINLKESREKGEIVLDAMNKSMI